MLICARMPASAGFGLISVQRNTTTPSKTASCCLPTKPLPPPWRARPATCWPNPTGSRATACRRSRCWRPSRAIHQTLTVPRPTTFRCWMPSMPATSWTWRTASMPSPIPARPSSTGWPGVLSFWVMHSPPATIWSRQRPPGGAYSTVTRPLRTTTMCWTGSPPCGRTRRSGFPRAARIGPNAL